MSSNTLDSLTIEPGRPDWESHLGGDFHQGQVERGEFYRWLGKGPGWIYLPPLGKGSRKGEWNLKIWAAIHFWGVGALTRLSVTSLETGVEQGWDIPPGGTGLQITVPPARLSISHVVTPQLTLEFGQGIRKAIDFHHGPNVQIHSVMVADAIMRSTRALRLEPNFGFAPCTAGSQDSRILSFRIHRLVLLQAG
jgi:hypothetical protein